MDGRLSRGDCCPRNHTGQTSFFRQWRTGGPSNASEHKISDPQERDRNENERSESLPIEVGSNFRQ